jgi:hypothetical protein
MAASLIALAGGLGSGAGLGKDWAQFFARGRRSMHAVNDRE